MTEAASCTTHFRCVPMMAPGEGQHSGAEALMVEDRPDETIAQLTEKDGISMIVMGATGYRDAQRLLRRLDSASEYVIKHASCPLLVVKARWQVGSSI